jgi:hypothetical protein
MGNSSPGKIQSNSKSNLRRLAEARRNGSNVEIATAARTHTADDNIWIGSMRCASQDWSSLLQPHTCFLANDCLFTCLFCLHVFFVCFLLALFACFRVLCLFSFAFCLLCVAAFVARFCLLTSCFVCLLVVIVVTVVTVVGSGDSGDSGDSG